MVEWQKKSEKPQPLTRRQRHPAWGSSGDDDASDQDIFRVGEFFATAFHVLKAEVDGFADIGEGLGDRLALGIAAGDRGADHDVAAIVLIGLEKNFEVACGHCSTCQS